jgi:hypothetical protein
MGGGLRRIEVRKQRPEKAKVQTFVTQRELQMIEVGVARPIFAHVVFRATAIRCHLGSAGALGEHEGLNIVRQAGETVALPKEAVAHRLDVRVGHEWECQPNIRLPRK